MKEDLFNLLNQYVQLSNEELNEIDRILEVKQLETGDYWFYNGLYAKNVAFIVKGYLRKYFIINGAEKTDFFYFENNFTGDLPSILENRPCKSFNIAMEPTTLLAMPHKNLNEIAKNFHNVEHLLRIFTEQGFVTYYNRATSFILQSPKERYLELIAHQPQVLQRVKQYHIASYLGITPQHLSRLRAS